MSGQGTTASDTLSHRKWGRRGTDGRSELRLLVLRHYRLYGSRHDRTDRDRGGGFANTNLTAVRPDDPRTDRASVNHSHTQRGKSQ